MGHNSFEPNTDGYAAKVWEMGEGDKAMHGPLAGTDPRAWHFTGPKAAVIPTYVVDANNAVMAIAGDPDGYVQGTEDPGGGCPGG